MIKKGKWWRHNFVASSLLGRGNIWSDTSNSSQSNQTTKKRTMKKLLLLLIFAPSAAFSQAVTPNFTQGSMQSTTTTTVDIERTIERELWVVITNHGRNKRHPQWGYFERLHNLFRNHCGRTVPTGDCRTGCGSSRDVQHRRGYRINLHHYLAVGLLSVSPAFATEDPTVHNNSNPVAAATGNVESKCQHAKLRTIASVFRS